MAPEADQHRSADRGGIEARVRERYGWLPYRVIGGLALFACAFAVIVDIAMWFIVDGYDPLGQTISELAAGPHHWIQDTGLVVFVGGILALTLGFVLRGRSGPRAWTVRGALLLLAVDITFIALWNEYGDGEPGGPVIHRYLLMVLYVLVPLILWLGTSVPPAEGDRLAKIGKGAALLWLVAAPVFFFVPDSIDGGYERLLGLVLVGSVALGAWRLYREPEEQPAS